MPNRIVVTPNSFPTATAPVIADLSETQVVPVSKLEPSPYNPIGRTDDVTRVGRSLLEDGQLEEVHAVAFAKGRLVLADGHCRLAGAILMGIKSLKTKIYYPTDGETAEELLKRLYVKLNEYKRTLKAGAMLNTAMQGGPTFNSGVRGALAFVHEMFTDEERLGILVPAKVTPTLINTARRTAAYVLPSDIGRDTQTFKNRVRNHVLYFVRRQDAQQAANIYVRREYDAKALKNAIDANKPIPRLMAKED